MFHEPLSEDQVEKIRRLSLENRSITDIATVVGCTNKTVWRYRRKLKLVTPNRDRWTTQMYLRAFHLLEDECPFREVARTLHVSVEQVKNRFPGMGYRGQGNPLGGGRHRRFAEEFGLMLS